MLRTLKTIIAPTWRERLRIQKLDSVSGVYESATGSTVTRSGSTEVRRVVLGGEAGGAESAVYIKRYWVNRLGQLWSGVFRGAFFGCGKARREFENLARLRAWGLDAPEPIAYGEERRARFLVRSFLISAGIPNPMPLDLYIRDRLKQETGPPGSERRRALIDALADATKRLHDHRFVHHDYFWRNIILSGSSLGHFFLIDAHKGRVWRPFQEQQARATDLAALDAPAEAYFRRTERLRFFLRYCGCSRLDGVSKELLRTILQRAGPMRKKQLERVSSAGSTGSKPAQNLG